MPLTDKVSDAGRSYLQMHANGMSSDMGHVATLLGVEPVVFGYATGTRYENYVGYVKPLAHFFNQLGYHTSFLSSASLNFLHQKIFLEYAGYQEIIGEEAFVDKKKYTFNAAPDGDLYDKAIEFVKAQTSPFFLTLQTISSHTPYNTPYGRTAEAMYRYEDETFSQFYEDLKATGFFENGLLVVIGDHRKMTPLEDEEFEKRGTTASSKIMAFIIGKGVQPGELDHQLYQQTDLFYSLLSEFGDENVKVWNQYNDLFTQQVNRNWTVKHWYDKGKVNIANELGNAGYIDLNRMEVVDGEAFFPNKDEILNYLQLSIDFQKKEYQKKGAFLSGMLEDGIYLISHRGVSTYAAENSLNAFKAAYDAHANGLEFDVTSTKDGKLIVYHGPKVSPHTTCRTESRDVCQMTWEELQACRFRDGQKILTLEEMLPQVKNWFPFLFLDFKVAEHPECQQSVETLLEQALLFIKKHKMEAKVIFSSYDKALTKLLSKR